MRPADRAATFDDGLPTTGSWRRLLATAPGDGSWRRCEPEERGAVIAFLRAARAGDLTGATINGDGGTDL